MKQFTAQEFVSASPDQRIRWCNSMAAEAAKLSAATESLHLQSAFRHWAKHMCAVADAIERELVMRAKADTHDTSKNRQGSLPLGGGSQNWASVQGSAPAWHRAKDQRRNRVLLFGD